MSQGNCPTRPYWRPTVEIRKYAAMVPRRPCIENTIPDDIEIELTDKTICYTETGNYTQHPAETIEKARQVLQKIGVVSVKLIDTRYTDGVPIYRLNDAPAKPKCHRQSCAWSFPPSPLSDPPRESFGKGMSVEQSKASAMMEAIERYCGQKFPHHGVIHACYDDVIDYALNPSEFKFPSQPPKCRDCPDKDWDCHQELHNICMEWSWGYSLTHRRPALIPAALIYYPYISDDNTSFMFNDTGGLAAGNIIEEAILQGIAEVIERDAHYATFNLGTLKNSPILNFKGTTNRYITRFIHESLPHEKIFAFEINHEMHQHHIPAFSALICYRLGDNIYYFGGSGANLDPEIALLRALTELEQQKVRQKAYLEFDRSHLVTQNTAGASHTAYIEDYPARSSGNIKKDIEHCVDRLSRNDMDIMVVNLTHPEIGIPVVRVIIPQLISYSGHPIEESFLKQMINLTD